MKGFKPTGYGPSTGFKYPTNMGFTGSTGAVTNVSPHVRRKAFANGGYVSKTGGDPGSSMVRRARPSTEADAESGGKSPLRPGFANGGRMGRVIGRLMEKAKVQQSSPDVAEAKAIGQLRGRDELIRRAKMQAASPGARQYTGGGALGAALASVARQKQERELAENRRIPTPGIKERFYEKGGKVVRPPKDRKQFTFMESVKAIPEGIKEGVRYMMKSAGESSTGMAKRGADTIGGRQKQIDDYVTRAERGYSRGGKAKRMGYAKGGAVSPGEAKKIAEKTVGEHVRYPAPKGHKGQRVCK